MYIYIHTHTYAYTHIFHISIFHTKLRHTYTKKLGVYLTLKFDWVSHILSKYGGKAE